ncbi:hypothetical protein [Nocardiopsis synnemataformans]|uniref:hypothetical protein n=1 Tax=Nocardiopsis synnemataformans TaxID=61305 RepID=UPI003EBF675B
MSTDKSPRPVNSRRPGPRSVALLYSASDFPELDTAYTAATAAAEDYLRGTGGDRLPHTHRALSDD